MTPEERKLVSDLFDRLAALEDAPRDPEAEHVIQDGLRQAPNAPYALVQTALVQDEALKRADARIRELEAELGIGAEPQRQGGFLDSMRESVWGRRDAPRAGSVPSVRPSGDAMGVPPGYRTEAQQPAGPGPMGQPQPAGGPGGSFLGTAAAAAAGTIGGSLLLNSIRSMMGQQGGGAHAAVDPTGGGSPFGGSSSNSDLARQAGLGDVGRGSGGDPGAGRGQGLVDSDNTGGRPADENNDQQYDQDDEDFDDSEDDSGGDFGGDDQ